ncbi:hypothetical protein D3C86_1504600 [compost metagenome]
MVANDGENWKALDFACSRPDQLRLTVCLTGPVTKRPRTPTSPVYVSCLNGVVSRVAVPKPLLPTFAPL